MSVGKLTAVFVKSALAFQKKGAGLHGIVSGMCKQHYNLYVYVLHKRERERGNTDTGGYRHAGDFAEHLGMSFFQEDVVCSDTHFNIYVLASFPGPTQLSIASVLQATESLAGHGNDLCVSLPWTLLHYDQGGYLALWR